MRYKVCQIQEKDIDKVIDFHNKYLGQRDFIKKIDLKNFAITQNSYNKTYNVNQIYIKANRELDLKYLSKLKSMFPGINIQYLYEKSF